MTHENPPIHYVTFFCNGYCDRFVVVSLQELENAVKKHNYKSMSDFCDSFFCEKCDATFTKAIESIRVKPLTLNDQPEAS